EAEAGRSRDPGFVKEQAALAALLGNPDVSALVARSFVPVRMRMNAWHFFDGGPGPFPDALPALGTTNRETRPPAILVATPEGRPEAAEAALRALEPSARRDALLAEVLLRRGLDAEVAAMTALAADPAGRVHLAFALEREGRADEARDLWRRTLAEEPEGPLAVRARLHLSTDGPRAREWETIGAEGSDALLDSTVVGSGGEAAAVRYLLGQQDPDGSWK